MFRHEGLIAALAVVAVIVLCDIFRWNAIRLLPCLPGWPKSDDHTEVFMPFGQLEVLFSLGNFSRWPLIIGQDLPLQPKSGAKVCVATVANASTTLCISRTPCGASDEEPTAEQDQRCDSGLADDKQTENGEEVNRTSATTFFSRKFETRNSTHSNGVPQRFRSVVVFPVWRQATDGEDRQPTTGRWRFALFRIGRFQPVWTPMC